MFIRSFQVEDIAIRSGGDGRTVEALAAVYDVPVPVRDHQGQYDEVIRPGAFRNAVAAGWGAVQVIYNHGMDLFGKPSPRFSMPLGVPLEIREDGTRGLVTVTRYANTELADEVLQLIKDGAIRGQSFRGEWLRSSPQSGFFRAAKSGARQLVERLDVSLMEYGPTPFPVYPQAEIVGVRSVQDLVSQMSDQDRRALVTMLLEGTPLESHEPVEGVTDEQGDQPDEKDPGPAMDTTPLETLERELELRRRQVQQVA